MSFSFAQAQNLTNTFQTNASNSEAYIPPTISKRAQEILKNLVSNAPSFVIPSPDDVKGWQKLNQEARSMVNKCRSRLWRVINLISQPQNLGT